MEKRTGETKLIEIIYNELDLDPFSDLDLDPQHCYKKYIKYINRCI